METKAGQEAWVAQTGQGTVLGLAWQETEPHTVAEAVTGGCSGPGADTGQGQQYHLAVHVNHAL